jgi:CBS domain-containing protein
LVLDEHYNLLGVVTLVGLLESVRHLCEKSDEPCKLGKATWPVSEIVIPFPAHVEADDGILKALDLMVEHDISLIPVMKGGKLQGLIQLSDIYNTVAHLLFDKDFPKDHGWIRKFLHLRW